MITHLHFKNGSSEGEAPLVLETPASVTIFVGPNNVGKSQALREIAQFCSAGDIPQSVVIGKLVLSDEDAGRAEEDLNEIKSPPRSNEMRYSGHSYVSIGGQRFHVGETDYLAARRCPNENLRNYAQWHLRFQTLNLDGPGRIGLVSPQGRDDLKQPVNQLSRLLTNDEKRAALRKTIYDAIGLYFAIDAQGPNLEIRFGLTPPPDERRFHDEALDYMRSARNVQSLSDGVKAYTGILLQIHAGSPKIIIVDEPEAFLHPSLAFKLGKELAQGASVEGKRIFVATHSAQFVMGAILSGAKVNIVRLTYDGSIGTARLLPSADLTKLMQDPLLRSMGVLAGLFYNYVIVGEADADRAFYQEVNERLLAADDPRSIPHALFLNADNKQTIPRIIGPLRKLGIPTVGIADIDILKDGGQDWTRHLAACNIPTSEHSPYGTRRADVLGTLVAKSEHFKKCGGIDLLSGSEREVADNLFDDLARYGLFIVRRGEVENWLPDLCVPRSKHLWLHSVFEKMGGDPSSPDYLRPAPGDVWDFINQIRSWVVNPHRRGIPK